MHIHWILETLCLLELPQFHYCRPVQSCPMMSKDPLPPKHPLILHFGHAGLYTAQIEYIDRFEPHITNLRVLGSAERKIP